MRTTPSSSGFTAAVGGRATKRTSKRKPQAFVDHGYVFVSANYRLVPQVTVKEMTGDIAQAIRWVHDHAAEYRGDPEKIFVAGHSAGAHLAPPVCTDDRYLQAEGLSLSAIKGCIPVDTAAYDVAEKVRSVGPLLANRNSEVFGRDEATQKELSPISHVVRGQGIPPFLILHVAAREDSRSQSEAFAKRCVTRASSRRSYRVRGRRTARSTPIWGCPMTSRPTRFSSF